MYHLEGNLLKHTQNTLISMPDTDNLKLISLLLIFLTFSFVITADGKSKKREVVLLPIKPTVTLPDIPVYSPDYSSEIFGLNYSRTIPDLIEFDRGCEVSDMPEEYDIWSDSKINPYQVDLVNMKDTVTLDLSGYCPPSIKYVTSEFGFRRWRYHYGIDLKVERNDSVCCAFDGVVRLTRYDRRGYGYYILVRHFNGLETLYGHLNNILVNPGDTIRSGSIIGLGGSTGRSTGYHLHFETRYLGNPINPNDLIDFESQTVKFDKFLLSANNFQYKKEISKRRYWTIRRGDTLGRIAMRTGVSVSRLCSLNGIRRSSLLRVGRKLRYT